MTGGSHRQALEYAVRELVIVEATPYISGQIAIQRQYRSRHEEKLLGSKAALTANWRW